MKQRLFLCALGAALCVHAQSPCSLSSASGDYVVTGQGQIYLSAGGQTSTTPTSTAFVGMATLDSSGALTGWVSGSLGGNTQDYQIAKGKVALNVDCTGTAEYQLQWTTPDATGTAGTVKSDLVVSNANPPQIFAVTVQSPLGNPVVREVWTRISSGPGASGYCSLPSVAGIYAGGGDSTVYMVAQTPPGTTASSSTVVVQASIDPSGNVTGVGVGSVGGTSKQFVIANGTMTVGVDCRGTLKFQMQDPETGDITAGWFTSTIVVVNSAKQAIYSLSTGTPWGNATGIDTFVKASSQ